MATIAEDVLTMWHLVNPHMLAKFVGPPMWAKAPWALLSALIGIGGIIVVYIIVKVLLARCILSPKYHKRNEWVLNAEGKREKVNRAGCFRSFKHVIVETLFFIGLGVSIMAAASIAGFDLLSSSLMSIALGLIATYMFSVVIQNVGAGYWIYLTDKIEEAQYYRMAMNPEVHGLVLEMHPLYALLECENKTGDDTYEIQVPMSLFLSNVWIRDLKAEKEALHKKDQEAKHDVEIPIQSSYYQPRRWAAVPNFQMNKHE